MYLRRTWSDRVSVAEIAHSQNTEKVTDSIIWPKTKNRKDSCFGRVERKSKWSWSNTVISVCFSLLLCPIYQLLKLDYWFTMTFRASWRLFSLKKEKTESDHLSLRNWSTLIIGQYSHPRCIFILKKDLGQKRFAFLDYSYMLESHLPIVCITIDHETLYPIVFVKRYSVLFFDHSMPMRPMHLAVSMVSVKGSRDACTFQCEERQ